MEKYSFKVPEAVSTNACHILPCKIDYKGTASKEHMQVEQKDGQYHTTFRGRPLVGHAVDLKGYHALELEQQEDRNRYRGCQLLEKYIIYDHGRDADHDDPWGDRLGDVLSMAEALV